ncbi:MAG: ShlB/FhaC/HecB family hemolysin secretion/activation protein [Chlamydiae bacterium]|nr:ShlB/FhaC/HecB family hemolysin secretion/activation protein [Chlamydiota bacterium]
MRLALGWSLLLGTSSLLADDRVDPSSSAGVLEKQVQREFEFDKLSPNKEVPLVEIDIPSRLLQVPEGISVFIKEIVVEGVTVLPLQKVEEVAKSYTQKELHGSDVKELCAAIDQLYANEGYILAWTYPPVQRIHEGTLRLQVLEGTIEQVEVEGTKYYKASYVHEYFAKLEGKPFNYYDVLRAMLLLNENFTLTAKAVVRQGQETGGVVFVVKAVDTFPLQISGGYNNWGSNSTTRNQMASEIDVGNVLCQGDKLSLMTSFGLPPVFYYVNPVYSIPLNATGTSLQLSYLFSFSNIQQHPSWDLTGWSEIGTIGVSQALSRTKRFDSNVYMNFSIEQIKNLETGITTSYDKLRILSFGGSLDYIDSVQGRNFVDSYFHIGIPDILGGSSSVDPLCSRPGAGGRFFVLNIDGQRLQPLWTDYLLTISASLQGTFNKIPLPEQLSLGGEGTIRGFPSGVACGDNGYFTNIEFHIPPPFIKNKMFTPMNRQWKEVLNFLVFLDHGGVFTNSFVEGEFSPAYLTAVGAGFRFYGPKNLVISLDAAFPTTSLYKQFNSFVYFRINMNFY